MKRIRRLLAATTLTLLAVVGPAMAGPIASAGADEWFCAAARSANRGVCVSDPFPERLPLP